MTDLEKEIYDNLIKTMDVDESELKGFDENSPLFAKDVRKGEATMGLDSIDSLELVIMIEKHWKLPEIPNDSLIQFRTVKEIAEYIESQPEYKAK